jgi:hypothetical protein
MYHSDNNDLIGATLAAMMQYEQKITRAPAHTY